MNNISKEDRGKTLATFEFSTLYIKLPHDKLKYKTLSIAVFAFKGDDKTFVRLSKKCYGIMGKEKKEGLGFSKIFVETALNHLIQNFHFNVGNKIMKNAIGTQCKLPSTTLSSFFFISMKKTLGHF